MPGVVPSVELLHSLAQSTPWEVAVVAAGRALRVAGGAVRVAGRAVRVAGRGLHRLQAPAEARRTVHEVAFMVVFPIIVIIIIIFFFFFFSPAAVGGTGVWREATPYTVR
jgi:hypothetical protein